MGKHYSISKENWDKVLKELLQDYNIYAPLPVDEQQEYELIRDQDISQIVYNQPKPTSPLKTLFLPVKENVVKDPASGKRMILGIPSCDLVGLGLLDEIYLDKDFIDPYYASKRENTLLIGTDCHNTQEHCHCISYDVNPYPEKHHDIALSVIEGEVFLLIGSDKGAAFIEEINSKAPLKDIGEMIPGTVEEARKNTQAKLKKDNKILPDYRKTGDLINKAGEEIWKNHSEDCVSCGACSAICPTCTCFLLVDRSGFEKIRQLDTCQYPGFERVAAGEDPLSNKSSRFRNRYMCKYVWRPQKFFSLACTGCGRCIEACIGRISKNELIIELSSKT